MWRAIGSRETLDSAEQHRVHDRRDKWEECLASQEIIPPSSVAGLIRSFTVSLPAWSMPVHWRCRPVSHIQWIEMFTLAARSSALAQDLVAVAVGGDALRVVDDSKDLERQLGGFRFACPVRVDRMAAELD